MANIVTTREINTTLIIMENMGRKNHVVYEVLKGLLTAFSSHTRSGTIRSDQASHS